MIQYVRDLIDRYSNKGILLDSNLFLLLLIGTLDLELIQKSKRTQNYTIEDFQILCALLTKFTNIHTTPNVLTEVSNLANISLEGRRKNEFSLVLSQYIQNCREHYIVSEGLTQSSAFPKLGLTDSGLLDALSKNLLLITDDFPLANYAQSTGLAVLNFNYLRQVAMGIGP